MQELEPLSPKWRITKSNIQVIELANALQSLSRVVGIADPRTKRVRFGTAGAGTSNDMRGTITVDATLALKQTPIDPHDFDVLVGLSAHEAAHTVLASEQVSVSYGDLYNGAFSIGAIAAVGEEIACDHWVRRHQSTLYRYLRRARDTGKSSVVRWDDVLLAWLAVSVYQQVLPNDAPLIVHQCLGYLLTLQQPLREKDIYPGERNSLYIAMYRKLAPILLGPVFKMPKRGAAPPISSRPEPHKPAMPASGNFDDILEALGKQNGNDAGEKLDASAGASDSDDDNNADNVDDVDSGDVATASTRDDDTPTDNKSITVTQDTEKAAPSHEPEHILIPMHNKAVISDELWAAITDAIDSEAEDVTVFIKDTFGIEGAGNIIMSVGPIDETQDINIALAKKLSWLLRIKNALGKTNFRFEKRGRLDPRSLYRIDIDEQPLIFQRRIKRPNREMKVVLLLDASSSMMSRTSIYDAAAALHAVLPRIDVWTYAKNTATSVTRVNSYGKIARVKTNGNTPSGDALLAIARKYPDHLIIHFTDGQSNAGVSVEDALEAILRVYPRTHVLHVEYGHSTLSRSYNSAAMPNNTVIHIDNIEEFPDILYREARKQLGLA